MAAGEGKLVVVYGDPAGRALVSDDGMSFSSEPLNLPSGLEASRILYASGKWLVLAGGRIWSKSNWSAGWTEGTTIPNGLIELRSLNGEFWGWSSGGFFSSGISSPSQVWRNSILYRSTDGLTWNAVTLSSVNTVQFAITDLCHAAGTYVLTNNTYNNPSGIWTSADGVTWGGLPQLGQYFHSITYGSGRFVAGGSGGRMVISTDAVNWTTAQFPFILSYLTNGQPGSNGPVYSEAREVTFSNGMFVALAEGYSGYGLLAESADGITWTAVSTGNSNFQRTQATRLHQNGNDTYLLGPNGNLWRTTLWQAGHVQLLPLNGWDWRAVAASATRLVIAGESGHLLWSDDAATFHSVLLPDAASVTDLIWVPELSLFLAVGGGASTARVWSSANGASWTSTVLPSFASQATGVAWSGTQLLVCGPGGKLATSTDGIQWAARESGVSASFTAIEWGGGNFVVTGSGGLLIHSADGVAWTSVSLGPETVTYQGVVYGNGLWIVPDGYELHQTTDLQNWWKSDGQAYGPNILYAFGEFITTNQRYLLSSSDGGYWQYLIDGISYDTLYSTSAGFKRGTRFGNRVIFVGDDGLIGASGEWRDFFQEWQTAKFTLAEREAAGVAGPDADPDLDGWSNAFEYAFDLNPKAREAWACPQTSTYQAENEYYFTGTVANFNHPWANMRAGVSIWPERSQDLVNWTRDGMRSEYPYQTGGGKMSKEVRLPMTPGSPEFIRLRAEIVTP